MTPPEKIKIEIFEFGSMPKAYDIVSLLQIFERAHSVSVCE